MEQPNRGIVGENRIHGHRNASNGTVPGQLLSARGRVAPIPDGTVLRDRYRVECFLRGSDVRNQYVVSWRDEAADGQLCYECGYQFNASDASACQQCASPLGERRFFLSERWRTSFQPYFEVMELGLFHPGLARVYDVFEEGQRLFTISELVDDLFLVSRSSPLDVRQIVRMGLEGCRLLEYLHQNGIALSAISGEHLVEHDQGLLLHDPEIAVVYPGEVPKTQRLQDLRDFGKVLRTFVPHDRPELSAIFDRACDGRYEHPAHLGEALDDFARRATPPPSIVQAAAMSDVGMYRTLNEDNWGWEQLTDDASIFVVADGMGGHDGGEIASELAVKVVLEGARRRLYETADRSEETLAAILGQAFGEANNTVKVYAEKHRSDMGTTLSGILIREQDSSVVANVGDTRTYLIRGEEMVQLTEDHSLVANLVTMGKITKDAARHHPHSNILIRTVGKEWDVEVDLFHCEIRPGDLFLICSDGLWGELGEQEVLELVKAHSDLRVACQELVRRANEHGGHDNITVMLVRLP